MTKQTKYTLMHPTGIKVKKPIRKPTIHDFIYLLLCIFIIIGFSDNVERFIKTSITPRIVTAQERIGNAKAALFAEKLIVPVSAKEVAMPIVEVKNPFNPVSPKGIAWQMNKDIFGYEHWGALEELITNESGWNPFVMNKSGACGIGQALPCEKMNCENWDYTCQVKWTINYIKDRYGNPTKAWNHWQSRVPVDGQDVGNWY